MKRGMTAVVVTIAVAGLVQGTVCAQESGVPREAQSVLDHFSKAALRAHMEFLADDLLEGRGTGTRGQELGALYVATQFEAAGLEPAGTKGSYLQQVPLREIQVQPGGCEFALVQGGKSTAMKWGVDWVARGNEVNPDSTVEAPVVFVGYGVVNRGRKYDDYAGLDVKGKIVAALFGAPETFPTEERAHFASGIEKMREAAAHGAVGMLTLRTPETEGLLPWSRSVIGVEMPASRWLDPKGVPNDSFKEIRGSATLSMEGAEKVFAGAEKTWSEVQKEAKEGKLRGFALPASAKLHLVSKHRTIQSPNVVGVLRGSDATLAGEYVVYSAHTDHLGIGRALKGDAIYNGAMDDASGTSALIEMARAFASMPKRPARSVLFLAATAEEKGLLGSDYFAHYPTVPVGSLVADVNMDGASVFYTFKDVVPLGGEHTTMQEVVERNAKRLGLQVSPDPMPEQVSFIRADHYSFVKQGVPAITIGEGLQAKDPKIDGRKFVEDWIETRYHAPSDDMQQPLDFDATIEFMQVSFLVGYDLAQERQRPTWKAGDFFGELYGGKK
jgi:Zn-dependent M28 family amino/carboxypeptidase